jgi:DNA-binding response OmpR family regulator
MKKIILIEDDVAIAETFSLALDPNQYELTCYDSGNPVLSRQISTPDLFIIDKNILGTHGINICRFIKLTKDYIGVPVIMISATPGIQAMAKEAGANDALEKPFTIKALREVVAKWI